LAFFGDDILIKLRVALRNLCCLSGVLRFWITADGVLVERKDFDVLVILFFSNPGHLFQEILLVMEFKAVEVYLFVSLVERRNFWLFIILLVSSPAYLFKEGVSFIGYNVILDLLMVIQRKRRDP